MLRSVKSMYGYCLQAADGEVGRVHDLVFDSEGWAVRYLEVDTGWLPGSRLLLAVEPEALGQPRWSSRTIPIALSRGEVQRRLKTDSQKFSCRREVPTYYGWPYYWGGTAPLALSANGASKGEEDSKLRSSRGALGYHICASDREVGHVEDFIVDDENWIIRYMVIDTRNWVPAKKVLVAPPWIREVRWPESRVFVDLSREEIEKSPEFNPAAPVNREYEERLYDYYGRPSYWI